MSDLRIFQAFCNETEISEHRKIQDIPVKELSLLLCRFLPLLMEVVKKQAKASAVTPGRRGFDAHHIKNYERELETNKRELADLDTKYRELQQLQDDIFTERRTISNLASQESVVTTKEMTKTKYQLEESNLLLSRLKADLELANRRLENERFNSFRSLDVLKKDLKMFRMEKAPLTAELHSLEKIKESQIKQWMSGNKNCSSVQLRSAQDAIDFIALLQKNRKLRTKVQDAEIEMRDLATAFKVLGAQKAARMKRLDKLTEDLQGVTSDDGEFGLKNTVPCLNLTVSESEELLSVVNVARRWHGGGKTLHRCRKITDLPKMVSMEIEDDVEMAAEAAVKRFEREDGFKDGEEKEYDGDGGSRGHLACCDLNNRTPSASPLSHMESAILTCKLGSRIAGQATHIAAAESATALRKTSGLHATGSSHSTIEQATSRHRN